MLWRLLELCFGSTFTVSSMGHSQMDSKLGHGRHRDDHETHTPRDFAGVLREAVTDADIYTMTLNPIARLAPQQKASLLGTLILTDFMFFENDNAACSGNGCEAVPVLLLRAVVVHVLRAAQWRRRRWRRRRWCPCGPVVRGERLFVSRRGRFLCYLKYRNIKLARRVGRRPRHALLSQPRPHTHSVNTHGRCRKVHAQPFTHTHSRAQQLSLRCAVRLSHTEQRRERESALSHTITRCPRQDTSLWWDRRLVLHVRPCGHHSRDATR